MKIVEKLHDVIAYKKAWAKAEKQYNEKLAYDRDWQYDNLEKRVSEGFSAFADELDALKSYVCDQQKQINELRRIIEEGR